VSSQPTVAYFIPSLCAVIRTLQQKKVESCHLCTTNHSLQLLASQTIDSSNDSEVSVQINSVLSLLVPETAYLVLLHNHPSQKTYPSKSDFDATQKLVALSELLHFKVLDHIIVTQNDYFSFAEAGILNDLKNPSS
jgi:DNA repair protein RadC